MKFSLMNLFLLSISIVSCSSSQSPSAQKSNNSDQRSIPIETFNLKLADQDYFLNVTPGSSLVELMQVKNGQCLSWKGDLSEQKWRDKGKPLNAAECEVLSNSNLGISKTTDQLNFFQVGSGNACITPSSAMHTTLASALNYLNDFKFASASSFYGLETTANSWEVPADYFSYPSMNVSPLVDAATHQVAGMTLKMSLKLKADLSLEQKTGGRKTMFEIETADSSAKAFPVWTKADDWIRSNVYDQIVRGVNLWRFRNISSSFEKRNQVLKLLETPLVGGE